MAFREFRSFPVFSANQLIGNADVEGGSAPTVPLTAAAPLAVTMQVDSHAAMKTTLKINPGLAAPVNQGQRVGSVIITAPDFPPLSVPVYAAQAVARENFVMSLWHHATGAFSHK
jgi:D-alanyl-D-alanine carboxypeptidase (penicillin-binding protein 5/6)